MGWYCECHGGFSINPKTARCRAGSACMAAAADDWQFRMQLDAGGCGSRPATACPGGAIDLGTLQALMTGACYLPGYLMIRVELVGGCPTLLEARSTVRPALADDETKFLSCFAPRLAATRFSCAASACAMVVSSTLP